MKYRAPERHGRPTSVQRNAQQLSIWVIATGCLIIQFAHLSDDLEKRNAQIHSEHFI